MFRNEELRRDQRQCLVVIPTAPAADFIVGQTRESLQSNNHLLKDRWRHHTLLQHGKLPRLKLTLAQRSRFIANRSRNSYQKPYDVPVHVRQSN